MATTTATFNKGSSAPSISSLAVNDIHVITGTRSTTAYMRKLRAANKGKKFRIKATGLRQHTITRIA